MIVNDCINLTEFLTDPNDPKGLILLELKILPIKLPDNDTFNNLWLNKILWNELMELVSPLITDYMATKSNPYYEPMLAISSTNSKNTKKYSAQILENKNLRIAYVFKPLNDGYLINPWIKIIHSDSKMRIFGDKLSISVAYNDSNNSIKNLKSYLGIEEYQPFLDKSALQPQISQYFKQ